MQAAIRGSREHVAAEVDDGDSPTVEEAFEKTTLSINKQKTVKGKMSHCERKQRKNQLIQFHSLASKYSDMFIE